MKEKRCTKCRNILPLDFFHEDKKSKDGRRTQCKLCRSEMMKKKERKKYKPEMFLTEDILKMTQLYKSTKISYFGYQIGILIYMRKKEILAFSVLSGSQVFKYRNEAVIFLIKKIFNAAKDLQKLTLSRFVT